MRKTIRALAVLLTAALLSMTGAAAAAPTAQEQMRGVWVSTVYNLDYPAKATTDAETLKKEADKILDEAKEIGLNAIFLQVRPTADAFYPSTIFPWSHWLTGTQGTAPSGGFDPLAYWVEGAHARGLELHAWINPYRITRDKNWAGVLDSHPAKQHPDWVVAYSDGNYYFDPGIPEVRELVVKGAEEIVRNYDVDGIHLDDYFYPGSDFDDADTYAAYGKDFDNIADWRRDNVNQLVAMLDSRLHAIDPDLAFGISPAGVWANKSTDPRGSDTKGGNESYVKAYADSLAWIEAGTVDYIIPQIYWEIGHPLADFATLTEWWRNAVKGSDVLLYIGLPSYRCSDGSTGVWTTTDPIFEQLDYLHARGDVSGAVHFRFGSLTAVQGFADELKNWYQTHGAVQEEGPDIDVPEAQIAGATGGLLGVLTTLIAAFVR